MHTSISLPTVQVRSNSLIFYSQRTTQAKRHISWLKQKNELAKLKTYSGEITPGSKRRLTKAISLLTQAAKWQKVWNPVTQRTINFKMAFMTLTIPDDTIITANQAYNQLLKPFLRVMRRKHQMHSYIWKAELQERGQIHYHLTLNTFIPMHYIQNEWNKIIVTAGYADNFYKQFGHWNPPSTHIRRVTNYNRLEEYLVKYCTKNSTDQDTLAARAKLGGEPLKGKIWGSSENLKQSTYYTELVGHSIEKAVNELVEAKKVIFKVFDRFAIAIFKDISPLSVFSFDQIKQYHDHFTSIRQMRFVT